jgi:hypothetical protein
VAAAPAAALLGQGRQPAWFGSDGLSVLRAGAVVTVGVGVDAAGPDARQRQLRVEDVGGDVLVLPLRAEDGHPVLLWPGSEVVLTVAGPTGAWLLRGAVVGRREHPRPVFFFRPTEAAPAQRREDDRVPVAIEPDAVWWWMRAGLPAAPPPAALPDPVGDRLPGLAPGVSPVGDGWRPVRATLVDLSSGGLGLVASGAVPVGALLHLAFPAPLGDERFTAWAQVVGFRPAPGAGAAGTGRRLGARLRGGTPSDQERWRRAVQRYQRFRERLSAAAGSHPL